MKSGGIVYAFHLTSNEEVGDAAEDGNDRNQWQREASKLENKKTEVTETETSQVETNEKVDKTGR